MIGNSGFTFFLNAYQTKLLLSHMLCNWSQLFHTNSTFSGRSNVNFSIFAITFDLSAVLSQSQLHITSMCTFIIHTIVIANLCHLCNISYNFDVIANDTFYLCAQRRLQRLYIIYISILRECFYLLRLEVSLYNSG